MADIICRWRNGTPQTVVELVNSLPHNKMTCIQFRKFMESKWSGAFFVSPYQLACQLALYYESKDGFYYPRFDHDITIKEAQSYLEHWLPRYYVPNPYVGRDGFKKIACPTYVLKSIYDYVTEHPNSSYETVYNLVFKEELRNNGDIMRNYINNFSKVLYMDRQGNLSTTGCNARQIFGFMDRNDKKAFFDNFNFSKKNLMDYYLQSKLDGKKKLFGLYLEKKKNLKPRTVSLYTSYHLSQKDVLNLIQSLTGKDNLYEVIDLTQIQAIFEGCKGLQVNKDGNNIFSAAVSNYKEFMNFLEGEDACEILKEEDFVETPDDETQIDNGVLEESFSIASIIEYIAETGLLYDSTLIKRFAFSLMSKRFLILSGLAGSGKTQLALAFSNALIESEKQMCVVSVGADWTNREPLLGFPNALQEGSYVRPECGVLDLLIEANKEENKNKPFFLILDEMNMSYVERYFADFLSAMESHEPIALWTGSENSDVPSKLKLPNNLFIIGTINVDETTYMFSPKVLDRANVIEFKISEDEMETFLSGMKDVHRDSINYKASGMGASFVDLAQSKDVIGNVDLIKTTLNAFFVNLKSVNAEFGYRSATEIYRFISQAEKNDDSKEKLSMDQILDCSIVQKLLPKLHGSRKKLEPVLQALWKECFENTEQKETMSISKDNVAKAKYPLTADKIQRMYESAYANGFTSFAEA